MSSTVLDQIVEDLQSSGSSYFPKSGEVKAVRVVGHTPHPAYYVYEIVLDFLHGSERVSAKIYRPGKSETEKTRELARLEADNLRFAYQAAEKRKLNGIPRLVGDFAALGAVVSTKINGLPLQAIIMKAALLPNASNQELLEMAATQAGGWLQQFHKATATGSLVIDSEGLMDEMEKLCAKAAKDGLPGESTEAILNHAKSTLSQQKKPVRASAVLQEFVPLHVLVAENGIGFCEFANLRQRGNSLHDAAIFLAGIEALEKYPFCDRSITTLVQDAFTRAYDVSPQEKQLLTVLKMKVLLQMFAQGRAGKESAVRKNVMWANVMKRFLQQAAERCLTPAA